MKPPPQGAGVTRAAERSGAVQYGAAEGTRTPTPLRERGPEPRASASSATAARAVILHYAISRSGGSAAGALGAVAAGISRTKRAPRPDLLAYRKLPSWACAILRAPKSPRPMPWGLVVTYG